MEGSRRRRKKDKKKIGGFLFNRKRAGFEINIGSIFSLQPIVLLEI
jgi:hypothetical protein